MNSPDLTNRFLLLDEIAVQSDGQEATRRGADGGWRRLPVRVVDRDRSTAIADNICLSNV